jgi:hypothetical protein
MAKSTVSVPPKKIGSSRPKIIWGLLLIFVGLFMFFIFGSPIESGDTTTLNLNLVHSNAIPIPSIIVPSQITIYVLALILICIGAYQLAVGIRTTGALAGVLSFCFVAAFLIWAAAGRQFNLWLGQRRLLWLLWSE